MKTIEDAKQRILERLCDPMDGSDAKAWADAYSSLVNTEYQEWMLSDQKRVVEDLGEQEEMEGNENKGRNY